MILSGREFDVSVGEELIKQQQAQIESLQFELQATRQIHTTSSVAPMPSSEKAASNMAFDSRSGQNLLGRSREYNFNLFLSARTLPTNYLPQLITISICLRPVD